MERRRRRPRSRRGVIGELLLLVVVVVLATSMVRSFLVAPFSIPSGSMEQTLHVGDRILVDRLSYRFHDVRRGDIVVFDGTEAFGHLGDGNGETDYVKRVIGLPGDHVMSLGTDDHGDGKVYVNGKPLAESKYLYPGEVASKTPFDKVVPPGHLWLMGDHRADSLDSRAHTGEPGGGMVPIDKVLGRVMLVVWPLDRLGRVPDSGLPDAPTGAAAGHR
ncbi:MAG: signal peptidase [Actinomycetota bacterium]|nr:signal peptidase [Actinomycetota bacterium]